jgi:hypothetical protein
MNRRQFIISSSAFALGLGANPGPRANPRLTLEGTLGSIYDELSK